MARTVAPVQRPAIVATVRALLPVLLEREHQLALHRVGILHDPLDRLTRALGFVRPVQAGRKTVSTILPPCRRSSSHRRAAYCRSCSTRAARWRTTCPDPDRIGEYSRGQRSNEWGPARGRATSRGPQIRRHPPQRVRDHREGPRRARARGRARRRARVRAAGVQVAKLRQGPAALHGLCRRALRSFAQTVNRESEFAFPSRLLDPKIRSGC